MSIRLRWSRFSDRSRAGVTALALAAGVAFQAGCTSTQTDGVSPSYLIIDSLAAASGAQPDEFGGTLASDVITFVSTGEGAKSATVFSDLAQVTFSLGLKDPGSANSPSQPSTSNFITVNRYRVVFIRADGRNTPGVDVPFGFDGAVTVTVGGSGATANLTLVRIQAKEEAPLRALRSNGGAQAISTIAEITFYGQDQAGREVTVVGRISVNFADWGDPS
jgi:hypothetical protein